MSQLPAVSLKSRSSHVHRWLSLIILSALLLSACTLGMDAPTPTPALTPAATQPQVSTPQPRPEALVTFRVQIPADAPSGQGIVFNILDEVTGLALNLQRYQMVQIEDNLYSLELPFQVGSVIKYRYSRQGLVPAEEHTPDGRQVRYRLLLVEGPQVIEDQVARWNDSAYTGERGRIMGTLTDQQTGLPVPGVLVNAGGYQTTSAYDGSFVIEGLMPGIHHLLTYSLDGAYRIFQQGAEIAANATTPVDLALEPARLVNIQFFVSLPADTPPAVPVRLAGNLYQLGNTFGNLSGGVSTVAARMPVLVPQGDGRYSLTLALPVGTDLRYKYTLGDGFWNAEHNTEGAFVLRQLIVPDSDAQVHDLVATWSDTENSYIIFDVDVPENTPPGDTLSIQFNPYSWMEPIPMWSLGGRRWVYFLYSPQDILMDTLNYRYCRNDQCNSADDLATIGRGSSGRTYDLVTRPALGRETISGWNWLSVDPAQTNLPEQTYQPRPENFIQAVELHAVYHPNWQARLPAMLASAQALQANWLFFTPTWTFTSANPPVIEAAAGQDPLWLDMRSALLLARQAGVQTAVFPTPRLGVEVDEWWAYTQRDFSWWVVWFERYRTFLLHHAELAQQSDAQALVLGGELINPALPGGTLRDGSPSGVPEDAETRWRQIIADVRQVYSGQIIWALPYTGEPPQVPFLDAVDQIYILWHAPLSDSDQGDLNGMIARTVELLERDIKPLNSVAGKPLLLGLALPSANGGITGCVLGPDELCLSMRALGQPSDDIASVELDLTEQAEGYAALLAAVDAQDWLAGVVTRGYYPPAALQDKSFSIHGKPAETVLRAAFSAWH